MKKFNKGDCVLVHATVFTKTRDSRQYVNSPEIVYDPIRKKSKSQGRPRPLMKVPEKKSWKGIVVGYSHRLSGFYSMGYGWDSPGDLWDQKSHEVVMVIPTDTVRWIKPLPCLEEDLEDI